MKKIVILFLMVALAAAPAYAKQDDKAQAEKKAGAGERIANETADSVADVLTGEDGAKETSKGKVPPGLAKKDKTPPGWDKGKKTGWDKKEEAPKKDSPIRRFVKGLFGQK